VQLKKEQQLPWPDVGKWFVRRVITRTIYSDDIKNDFSPVLTALNLQFILFLLSALEEPTIEEIQMSTGERLLWLL
jgi:hypothetical protein